jgi:hypothetical protein
MPLPVIGFLDSRSSDGMTSRLASFRQGLKEIGFVEGENVSIIYRWAEDRVDRLMNYELRGQLFSRFAAPAQVSSWHTRAISNTLR